MIVNKTNYLFRVISPYAVESKHKILFFFIHQSCRKFMAA